MPGAGDAQLVKSLNRLTAAVENFTDVYRRVNDTVLRNS